jgi:hypothetical protein
MPVTATNDIDRIISIFVEPPKVDKASTVLTAKCRCPQHYHAKTLPMETQPYYLLCLCLFSGMQHQL